MSPARAIRILLVETKYEFLKLVRLPAYVIPVIAFPLMFYALFGVAIGGRSGGSAVAAYMLGSMGAFGVIGASMFGLGVSVASERGQGWLTVKRASPMPMAAYFGAKVLMAMMFSAVIVALLFIMGSLFGNVRFTPTGFLALAAALVFGAIPFCALGLAIGYLAGPNSAPPIVNMIYLPMSFGSGLWMPLTMLPAFMRSVAPLLPPYHLSQLAMSVSGLSPGSPWKHIAALSVFTVGFLALAALGYARDEGRTYG
jgi:ABC-2 type transport system permease protein